MSSYFNEAGEPLMTASQARFEAYLDADRDPYDSLDDWDEPDYDDEPLGMTDVEADADTLTSAGMGTDEDYGYFGEDEYGMDYCEDYFGGEE